MVFFFWYLSSVLQAVSVFGPGRVQILEGCSINSLIWIPWKDKLPQNAFRVGRTYDGEDVFLGRSCIRGRVLFGRKKTTKRCKGYLTLER